MAFSMDYGTGFEMGSIGLVRDAERTGGVSITSTNHTGNYGLRIGAHAASTYIDFNDVDGSPSEYYLSVWTKPYYPSDEQNRLYFMLDSGSVYLQFNVPNWDAYTSDGLLASGTVDVNDAWHHVQTRLLIDDSTGILQTRIDGVADIDFSGDTRPGTASSVSYIRLYMTPSGGGEYAYFDDLCFGAGGWPGDIRFEALVPNADTATINWTGSDADQTDNYALIDETPPETADYVESTANGDQDKYDLEDFTATNKDPLAVVLWAYAKKDEAAAHQLKLILDDGTEDVGAAQDLLTSYTYLHRLDLTKPSGGDWTDAALDALEVGVESVIV